MRGMKAMALVDPPAEHLTEDCYRRLNCLGIRPTAQRVQIAELLLSAPQHLSAEQILASLRRAGARVSKATVYNTLNLFAATGSSASSRWTAPCVVRLQRRASLPFP